MEKNFRDLCYACRIGDKDNVDRLASTGVNLNDVDQFDNSPLFLASLCGHEEVVKLLLKRGAVCDRDRYEGARCIYGALTDSIRDILLRHDISKAVDINQPFTMHIASLIKDTHLDSHDICLGLSEVKQSHLHLHRFVLSARSSNLKQRLLSVWEGKHTVNLSGKSSQKVLNIIAKFIYLIPVLHEINPEDYETLIGLSGEWGMVLLSEFLDKSRHILDPSEKSTLMAEYQYKFTEIAREQLCSFVNDEILKNAIDVEMTPKLQEQSINNLQKSSAFPDLLLLVQNSHKKKRIFPCHIAILSRANYFKLMFTLPLAESTMYRDRRICDTGATTMQLPIIPFPSCEFEVIEIIFRYLYYDNPEIPWQYAIDVLLIADHLLEDRMKSMAAVVITQNKELLVHYSIFDILDVAWETRMERLEHHVAKLIAFNIKDYAEDPRLKEAFMRSSQRISVREETDTIELVDDIRFYLLNKYAFEPDDIEILSNEEDVELLKNSGIVDYQQDISLIEGILEELALQA